MTAPAVGRWVIALLLGVGLIWAWAHRDAVASDAVMRAVDSLGVWGGIGFVFLYVLVALLLLPGSALTLAAGALFGPIGGTLYSLVGATLGAAAAFAVSRFVAADFVRSKMPGRLESVVAGVEKSGARFVAFTRLVPIFPYNILNYAFGLTRIKMSTFVVVSAVTMAPGAAAYAYLGYAGQQLAAGTEDAIQTFLLALSAVVMLAMVSFLMRRKERDVPA